MGYGWSVSDLRDSLLKLERIINNTKNIEDEFYYKKVYGYTLKLLDRFVTNAKPYRKPNNDEKVQDLLDDFYINRHWYSLVEEVYKRVECVDVFSYDATHAIEKVYGDGKNFVFNSSFHFPHDRTISMVDDFYRGFDSELHDYFREIYDRRYKAFDFIKNEGKDEISECFLIDGPKDFFINIVDYKGVGKYSATVHECGHVIEFLMNSRMCYDDNPNYFTEVASIFPELVALYEGSLTNKDEYLYQFFCSLVTVLDDMANLIDHELLVSSYIDNDYRINNDYFKSLRSNYDLSKKDFNEAVEVKIGQAGTYITSLGVALELLHIYKQDKKRALELFKKILMVQDNSNINANIMALVPYGDGIEKELSIFKDEFSLVLDRKGVKL